MNIEPSSLAFIYYINFLQMIFEKVIVHRYMILVGREIR